MLGGGGHLGGRGLVGQPMGVVGHPLKSVGLAVWEGLDGCGIGMARAGLLVGAQAEEKIGGHLLRRTGNRQRK